MRIGWCSPARGNLGSPHFSWGWCPVVLQVLQLPQDAASLKACKLLMRLFLDWFVWGLFSPQYYYNTHLHPQIVPIFLIWINVSFTDLILQPSLMFFSCKFTSVFLSDFILSCSPFLKGNVRLENPVKVIK